jgi:hypothetical protein
MVALQLAELFNWQYWWERGDNGIKAQIKKSHF